MLRGNHVWPPSSEEKIRPSAVKTEAPLSVPFISFMSTGTGSGKRSHSPPKSSLKNKERPSTPRASRRCPTPSHTADRGSPLCTFDSVQCSPWSALWANRPSRHRSTMSPSRPMSSSMSQCSGFGIQDHWSPPSIDIRRVSGVQATN